MSTPLEIFIAYLILMFGGVIVIGAICILAVVAVDKITLWIERRRYRSAKKT